ncbi:hypothetical protein NUM3379_01860 [Kineococcus sp. NUM-3379]
MSVAVDVSALPATQYLVMSVLAARHRSGSPSWEFRPKVARALRDLEVAGLVELGAPTASKAIPVTLTPAGAAAVEAGDEVPAPAPGAVPVPRSGNGGRQADAEADADVEAVRGHVEDYLARIDPAGDPAGVEVRRTVAVSRRGEHVELDVEVVHVVAGSATVSAEWSAGLLAELARVLHAHGCTVRPRTAALALPRG